jgi:hypothetical protein
MGASPRRGAAHGGIGLQTPTTAAAGRRPGLRAHIVALVAAALLPAFAVGAIAVAAAVDSYGRAFEDRLGAPPRRWRSAMGSEIETHLAALGALATARELDGGAAGARPIRPTSPTSTPAPGRWRTASAAAVFLIGRDGTQALHTDFPPGSPRRSAPARSWTACSRRRHGVTDLMVGRVHRPHPGAGLRAGGPRRAGGRRPRQRLGVGAAVGPARPAGVPRRRVRQP